MGTARAPARLWRMRRPLTKTLHWSTALSLLSVIAGGRETPDWIAWFFAISAMAFALSGLAFGRMTKRTPRLSPRAKVLHTWSHRGLYALAAWAALTVGAPLFGLTMPGPSGFDLVLMLLPLVALHTLFHLWRSTVLLDPAFRLMLPRSFYPAP